MCAFLYNPIVKIDIEPLFSGNLPFSKYISVIRMFSRICRPILTYTSDIPKKCIKALIENENIKFFEINSNYKERKNALGNLLKDGEYSVDYSFTLGDDFLKHSDEINKIENFYLKLYEFDDGAHIGFKCGKFDNWCIDFHYPNGDIENPLDTFYFSELKSIAEKYPKGHDLIYNLFVDIYDKTSKSYNSEIIDTIINQSKQFGNDSVTYRNCMAMIYLGMIAEENKKNAILKKRIKRLGMHQIFIEGTTVDYAANFSRKKDYQTLSEIMTKRGF